MADAKSTIQLIFEGIDNASEIAEKVGGSINGALNDMSAFGDIAATIAAPLAEIVDKVLETEAAITALGVAMIGAGVNAAAKFNDSINFTSTLFEATAPQLQKFKDDVLDYAAGSTQSLDSINAALQNAIGQGIDYADSLGVLAEAEKLAVAQGASLDDATGLLVGTLNGYGLKIADAAKLSDQFSITIRDGKISVGELSAQLSNITPLAASAGIGFDQIGSALAVLTAQGFVAGPAITGVKQILEGIIKPTGEAAAYADSLGLSFDATTLKSRGLQGILSDVQTATGGNVEAFSRLFTTSEGLTAALALAGTGSAQFKNELEKMKTETEVTSAAFEKMADNIGLGSQKMKNAIEVAFINLGTPLLDELGTLQSGIAEIFSKIGDEFQDGGALRPITEALEAWGVDIGGIIAAIAKNLPAAFENVDVTNLIESYKNLGEELGGLFKSFFGDIDLSTVEGLSEAVQKIIDTLATLTNISAGIINAFDPMAAAAGSAVDAFNGLDEASKIEFGEFLGAARAVILAGPEIAAALLLFGKTALDVGSVVNSIFGGVQVVINALQVTFDAVVLGILNIQKAFLEAGLAVAEFGGKFALTDEAAQKNQEAIANFTNRLSELEPVMDGVAANLARNKGELEEGWTKATSDAADKTDGFRTTLDNAQKSVSDFSSKTRDAGAEVRESVKSYDGILAKLSEIKPTAELAADAISSIGDAQRSIIGAGDLSFNDEPIKNLKKTWDEYGNPVFSAIGDVSIKATGHFKSVGDSANNQAEKVKEATKAADEYRIKMEEIASNERIKTIEAAVNLNIAQLEADVERVKATFASIDNTVTSTGDLIGSLFGSLTSTDDPFKEWKIESQIKEENRRRDEALKLQQKLAEAEIARIEAQTAALNRGDSMLTVHAEGLQPHLESIWWEILKAIRVQMNAEFSNYLLGAAAA